MSAHLPCSFFLCLSSTGRVATLTDLLGLATRPGLLAGRFNVIKHRRKGEYKSAEVVRRVLVD